MARHLRIIQTEAGNVTVGSSKRHVDGDDNEAGSGIYLLPLNNKGILLRAFYSIWIDRAAVFLSQQKLWWDKRESVAGDTTEDIWFGICGV